MKTHSLHLACLGLFGLMIAASTCSANSVDLISARFPGGPLPDTGNGASAGPAITPDGRFILFISTANDLVANDNGTLNADVFLRDRNSNSTSLVSINLAGSGGGNGNSGHGVVSTNGRYVAFESTASDLVPADTNGVSDIFIRDLQSATNQLVSVAITGCPGNGDSTDAVMTPDGRFVAFVSMATDLVPDDTNGVADVFVRDIVSQQTVWVTTNSVAPATSVDRLAIPSATPAITPDGRYVVFATKSRGLDPSVTATQSVSEVYLRDLVAGTTTWVSSNAAAVAALPEGRSYACFHPVISDDGRFIAFGIGTNDTISIGNPTILRFDANDRSLTVVATNCASVHDNSEHGVGPEMTPDGRFIVSVEQHGNDGLSIRVWDDVTRTNTPASVSGGGIVQTQWISHTPVLTPDGRFVAFMSNAPELVEAPVSNGFHLYLRDLVAGTNQVLDVNSNNVAATDIEGNESALSADGRFVAFASLDPNMAAMDENGVLDVFVRDVLTETSELVSRRDLDPANERTSGAGAAGFYSISADGRWIAYSSYAHDLVPHDTNETEDVFVCDLLTGSNILVSVGMDGFAAQGGSSTRPAISADGRFVAFVSTATNLVPTPNYFIPQIYRRDLVAGTTALVTLKPDGSIFTGDYSTPLISQDGRYITFVNMTASGDGSVYWRDMQVATNVFLSSSVWPAPSMSVDGRFVAYAARFGTTRARVYDAWSKEVVFTSTDTPAGRSMHISPDGTRLAFMVSVWPDYRWTLLDIASGTVLKDLNAGRTVKPGSWSSDGNIFAFVSTLDLLLDPLVSDSNGTNDVYACNLVDGQLTLVSVNADHSGNANGPSDSPVVSGHGRFVVYRSLATDIVANSSPLLRSIYAFDRFTGSNSLLTAGARQKIWPTWAGKPVVSADGGRVVFGSWNSGLVPADLNNASDVFVAIVDAATDTDQDGIPDEWLVEYFGHPTGQAGDQSRAEDDPDNDGATNLQEFAAGTDPKNASSVLRGDIVLVVAPNGAILKWPAAPGRSYKVELKDRLPDAEWLPAPGPIAISGGLGSYVIPAEVNHRFYRISVQ